MHSLYSLAKIINAEIVGNGDTLITGVASLASAREGSISYSEGRREQRLLMSNSNASALIIKRVELPHWNKTCLIVKDPRASFAQIVEFFNPPQKPMQGIHPTAIIEENAIIPASVAIGPYAVIGAGVVIEEGTQIGAQVTIGPQTKIGKESIIYAGVHIYHDCVIGNRVVIHSGAVIGADGFGFYADEAKNWVKIPQIGRVIVGDDVEIGANTTIDRGTLDDTIIGNGVKLDNLVMVGHNCKLGDHTIMAGCAGVAGSTQMGRYVMIGGGSCIGNHLELGDHVAITGMGMVHKSIDQPGIYSSGTGLQTNREWHHSVKRFWRLKQIESRLAKLEKTNDESQSN